MRVFSFGVFFALTLGSISSFANEACTNQFQNALIQASNAKVDSLEAANVTPFQFVQNLKSDLEWFFFRSARGPNDTVPTETIGRFEFATLNSTEIDLHFVSGHYRGVNVLSAGRSPREMKSVRLDADSMTDPTLQNLLSTENIKTIVQVLFVNGGQFPGPYITAMSFGFDANQKLIRITTHHVDTPIVDGERIRREWLDHYQRQ